jgi:elongation factor P--(R)-beta-lysine ligase
MSADEDWRPLITRERLELRARLLARARGFFGARAVLEVDTPVLVNAPVSDVHLHSAQVQLGGSSRYFLHTSPEYAMKRLLAAGSGDIYQICHVVRGEESGRLHNPEFTLIEWYRLGFSLDALMQEVEALVRALLGEAQLARRAERISYREAFVRALNLDPFTASEGELAHAAATAGFRPDAAGTRTQYLELIMGALIGPALAHGGLTFVHDYPADQAALARLSQADPRAAERFELYADGLELANGFHELADAKEQRQRFAADNQARAARGLPVHAPDERLLGALAHGLPDCAGVALGFDRVLMLASGASRLEQVLPFPTARA